MVATLVIALIAGASAWALVRDGDAEAADGAQPPSEGAPSADGGGGGGSATGATTGPAPTGRTADDEPGASTTRSTRSQPEPVARPIVWVQAGHAEPREPGYKDQTGAGSGPFGSEVAFTSRLARQVVARLAGEGVDARLLPGRVDPVGAPGASFVSLHHDAPGGSAAIAGAVAGTGENYYHGEGSGDPSPTPYPDSASHRQGTEVSPAVERASSALAQAIARRYSVVFTRDNGAETTFAGVVGPQQNPRMTRYYGFFRTGADARVIVETGAAGADDRFLARTDLIAEAIGAGILDDLDARGLLDPG